jgi:hypothetical protein
MEIALKHISKWGKVLCAVFLGCIASGSEAFLADIALDRQVISDRIVDAMLMLRSAIAEQGSA